MSDHSTSQAPAEDELYPIRDVVSLTGINPVTLRAWERRYGLIQPIRTEGGHRLYTKQDIATVRAAMHWAERGVAVSKIGDMLQRMQAQPTSTAEPSHEFGKWQQRIQQAVQSIDDAALDLLYSQTFTCYPFTVFLDEIWLPVWQQMAHEKGLGQYSQWLFLDTFLRTRLMQQLHTMRQLNRPSVAVAALSERSKELTLLSIAASLSSDEYIARVLSPLQPLNELAIVCQALKPCALVLVVETQLSQQQLKTLTKLTLAIDCPLAVAGVDAVLLEEHLKGSAIANLGSNHQHLSRLLKQFLAGQLDT